MGCSWFDRLTTSVGTDIGAQQTRPLPELGKRSSPVNPAARSSRDTLRPASSRTLLYSRNDRIGAHLRCRPGDIAYAPAQTWHRVRFAGAGMATRLAIVGYANSHVFQATGDRSGQ